MRSVVANLDLITEMPQLRALQICYGHVVISKLGSRNKPGTSRGDQMDNRALALKLVLDHLDTTDISTVEDRMEVQKAIYLAQAAGVSLGYSYGWYVKGPYSPALTRDYYGLGSEDGQSAKLKSSAVEKLNRVKALMAAPIDGLRRPQKLELLASLHYLLRQSGMSEATAKKRITATKPHLSAFSNRGIELLREYSLV